jgi:hypothetical protein
VDHHSNATKNAGPRLQKFVDEVDRDMGMKVMVMAAWIGKDQELMYST